MARIVLVNSEGGIGGAETSLLLLLKHLCGRFALSVACPAPSPLSAAVASLGIDHHAIPEPPRVSHGSPCRGAARAAYEAATVCRLTRAIRRTGANLVHANSLYAGVTSLAAAVVTRRRLLLHARDLADFGILTRLFGRCSNCIVAVSHAVRRALISRGVHPDKIEVVYNGLDCTSPGPKEAFRSACKGRNFTFAHIGQFVPWKNHAAFLRAAAQVAPELPQARFAIVGDDLFQRDGTYKEAVHQFAERSSAAERIQFWGWREDMEEVWPAIDCLVHTAEREAFGRVVIEAMAHRVPVIAVASGGPAEILQANRTGLLAPPGDLRALVEAMLRVARDRELADRIAEAGYHHALSNFTACQTAARVQGIYESILST